LFERLLKDEEAHVDWLEAQINQIGEMGYERYLSQQIREDKVGFVVLLPFHTLNRARLSLPEHDRLQFRSPTAVPPVNAPNVAISLCQDHCHGVALLHCDGSILTASPEELSPMILSWMDEKEWHSLPCLHPD
jgi:hypothetical protein